MNRLHQTSSAEHFTIRPGTHTLAVHVQQRIWVVAVAADYDSACTQLLRLPRFLDERTTTPLYESNPRLAWVRRVRALYAELWAAQDRIGMMLVSEVGGLIVAWSGE